MGASGNYQYADPLCENTVPESQSERGIYSISSQYPTGIYLSKFNNRNTRTMCEICSKLTIKTTERRSSVVFIVNFEQISHIVLVFLLLALDK